MNTNQSTIIDLQKRVAEDSRSALDSILVIFACTAEKV